LWILQYGKLKKYIVAVLRLSTNNFIFYTNCFFNLFLFLFFFLLLLRQNYNVYSSICRSLPCARRGSRESKTNYMVRFICCCCCFCIVAFIFMRMYVQSSHGWSNDSSFCMICIILEMPCLQYFMFINQSIINLIINCVLYYMIFVHVSYRTILFAHCSKIYQRSRNVLTIEFTNFRNLLKGLEFAKESKLESWYKTRKNKHRQLIYGLIVLSTYDSSLVYTCAAAVFVRLPIFEFAYYILPTSGFSFRECRTSKKRKNKWLWLIRVMGRSTNLHFDNQSTSNSWCWFWCCMVSIHVI